MKLRRPEFVVLTLMLVIQSVDLMSQTDSAHWNYIAKYSQAAINEMHYSKIPASITMAQALHESRYGTSELAVKANNHFGIKCQMEWTGKRYTYQDDDSNNCFRLYDSVAQSYRDHSLFLMTRPRYAFLFNIPITDYAAWANGLKQAGYATNPNYGRILIKMIEDYKLFLLDEMQPALEVLTRVADTNIVARPREMVPSSKKILKRNRINYFVVREGDNIASLTKDLNLLKWQIRKYNEIPKDKDVRPGQVIYLQPKRTMAEAGYSFHTAVKGESMYNISQAYGIKLKWLYKRNRMPFGTQPKVGQLIRLRN